MYNNNINYRLNGQLTKRSQLINNTMIDIQDTVNQYIDYSILSDIQANNIIKYIAIQIINKQITINDITKQYVMQVIRKAL